MKRRNGDCGSASNSVWVLKSRRPADATYAAEMFCFVPSSRWSETFQLSVYGSFRCGSKLMKGRAPDAGITEEPAVDVPLRKGTESTKASAANSWPRS